MHVRKKYGVPLSSEYGTQKTIRPDSGLDFQVKVLKPFELLPLRSEAACEHKEYVFISHDVSIKWFQIATAPTKLSTFFN